MLRRLEIRNYKAFRAFDIDLGRRNLLIGPNNAGKSTLVSVLRLVAHLVRPGQLRGFERVDSGLGVLLDLDALDIPTANLGHNYARRPSKITAYFDENFQLQVTLSANGPCYARWFYDGGDVIRPEVVRRFVSTSIGAVPPVAPVELEENVLTERYVRGQIEGRLSSRHFRNQWYHHLYDLGAVQDFLEDTLPSIRITAPRIQVAGGKAMLHMLFREGSFSGEIAWAGDGIQVWLQILSHLVRLRDRKCVILDEPDVYLHPDLQRRIVQLSNSLDLEQLIVASHSVDILNEFAPEEVIYIDKARTHGRLLAGFDEVQRLVSDLGSIANINVARLVRSKVCLFVEGDDFQILRRAASAVGLNDFALATNFAVVQIEGFSNWERLLHVDWVIRNLTSEVIRLLVVLDRDYRCDDEVNEITKSLAEMGVQCHVWNRKELENYLLVPAAIAAAINRNESKEVVTEDEIDELLSACAGEQRLMIEAQRVDCETEFRRRKKAKTASATVTQRVLEDISSRWENQWRDMVAGKDLLSSMRHELQERSLPSPSNNAILASMTADQIHPEIVRLCRTVCQAAAVRKRKKGG